MINIINAFYGRSDSTTCMWPEAVFDLSCSSETALISLRNKCENEESCLAIVENDLLGGDPCYGTYKYFTLDYTCGTNKIKF